MINQTKIKQLNIGDDVDHFLLVNKYDFKTTKAGKEFLDLMLSDDSGIINAKIWDGFEPLKPKLKNGMVLKIKGVVTEFMGAPQIKTSTFRISVENDGVSAKDFLPKSERPLSEMLNELYQRIDFIQNPFLKDLLKLVFEKNKLNQYQNAPAGKAWHHAYIHGLLEHTLEIVKICDLMCDIHKILDRDLLITGAILHDFGKTEELEFENNFDYTDKGKLLGHIVIAAIEIDKQCAKISEFPDELKNKLIHLVLSHQGKLEFATPVEPKFIEAIVLYHADELSAKTNAYKSAVINDANSGSDWTRYLPLAGTSLLIPGELKKK